MASKKVNKEIENMVDTPVFSGFSDSINPAFSPIESLRYRRSNEGDFRFFSDLYFIFNMERIVQSLGVDTARAIISSMNNSSLQKSISPDIPDDQRLALVKSRFLQSPSEVSSWYSSLKVQLDSFKSDYDALLQDAQAKELRKLTETQSSQNDIGNSDSN